jgi:hypothetical protein
MQQMRRSTPCFLQHNTASAMVVVLALWYWTAEVGAIWLELPPHGVKCLSEEIQPNVVIFGNYTLFSNDISYTSTMSVKVEPLHLFNITILISHTAKVDKVLIVWRFKRSPL